MPWRGWATKLRKSSYQVSEDEGNHGASLHYKQSKKTESPPKQVKYVLKMTEEILR